MNVQLAPQITRIDVEDFLFAEAALLDSWKLQEWLALFTDDGQYLVPSTDIPGDSSPDNNLFYIADDHARLEQRVIRLMKKTAFSEHPRSKTRHIVSNVRVVERSGEECRAEAAFVTYRSKMGNTDAYVGSSHYRLVAKDGTFLIREKRCVLDMENLRPHGRISILL